MIENIKARLLEHYINPASTIEYEVNGKRHCLSLEEIALSYMQASESSQQIFVAALEQALQEGKTGVQNYFEKMGEMLLMSALSQKFET